MQAAVCSDTNIVHSMMASSSILLRGGILLMPDGETDAVVAVRKDLLVVADRIACIEEDTDLVRYEALDAIEVDCSAKIVSTGFIDTHHHLWRTQLKGQHADDTVLGYMASGNLSASFFTPADVFWGQLGGALEAMDAGITTVVDHAHINYSTDHCDHGLAATLASGVRSVFSYTPTPLVDSWTRRLGLVPAILQPWHLPQLRRFRSLLADHARVALGFAFDGFAFLSAPDTRALFDAVRAAGVRCITSQNFLTLRLIITDFLCRTSLLR
jgi:cytosine/adenosine deaminase-related metal-dependent hydrolase